MYNHTLISPNLKKCPLTSLPTSYYPNPLTFLHSKIFQELSAFHFPFIPQPMLLVPTPASHQVPEDAHVDESEEHWPSSSYWASWQPQSSPYWLHLDRHWLQLLQLPPTLSGTSQAPQPPGVSVSGLSLQPLSSLHTHSRGDLMHSHGFRHHLGAEDASIAVTSDLGLSSHHLFGVTMCLCHRHHPNQTCDPCNLSSFTSHQGSWCFPVVPCLLPGCTLSPFPYCCPSCPRAHAPSFSFPLLTHTSG